MPGSLLDARDVSEKGTKLPASTPAGVFILLGKILTTEMTGLYNMYEGNKQH